MCPCTPASTLDVILTSTLGPFSRREGLCNNVSQIMSFFIFLLPKILKILPSKDNAKGMNVSKVVLGQAGRESRDFGPVTSSYPSIS